MLTCSSLVTTLLTILCHVVLTTSDGNATRQRVVVFPSNGDAEYSPQKPEIERRFLSDEESSFQNTQGSSAKILFYSDWSEWSVCSINCEQTRKRRCQKSKKCGNTVLKETRPCPTQHNRRHKRKCHRTQNRRKHKHKGVAFHVVQLYNTNTTTKHGVPAPKDGRNSHRAKNEEVRASRGRGEASFSQTSPGGRGGVSSGRGEASFPQASPGGRVGASSGRGDPTFSQVSLGGGGVVTAVGRSAVQTKYDNKLYGKWGPWADCSRSCTTRRYRWCKRREVCGDQLHKQAAYCYVEGSYCQMWIHRKIQQNGENEADVDFYVESYRDRRGRGKVDRGRGPNKTETAHAQPGSECGVAGNASSRWTMTRIIGGRPTLKGRWPWQVAVLNKYKEAFCGGTMVAPQWVLTAAHCVRKRLYVRIGEHDLSETEGTEIELRVSQMISHPSYDPETVDNDVALLRLPLVVRPDRYRGLACLPRPRQALPTSQYCTIIGWGKRKSSDSFGTDVLHEAQVPIVSNDVCRNVYEDYHITNNMFCAGYRRGRMDSCAGDSGGPLLCKDDNKWTIFGITSFGEGCGKRGKYGIYTRLSNYIKWIQRTIRGKGKRTIH